MCNLNCGFCPKTKRPPKFMSHEEFSYIAEKVRPYSSYIYFHVMGEPLLHPELERFMETAGNIGFKVNLTTNGTLLRRKKDILLNSKALHMVSVSMHSFEDNENLCDIEKYVEDIIDFSRDASDNGIICSLRLWNINGKNLLNGRILNKIEKEFGLEYSICDKMKNKRNFTVKPFLYIETAERFEWPDIEREYINDDCFCHGLRDHAAVLCDGTVVPCCLDHDGDICLGNLFEMSLYDILTSERARNIYDGFTGRKPVEELCGKCGYVRKFRKQTGVF